MTIPFKLNIDKLRVCYVGPNSLAVKLENRDNLSIKNYRLTKIAQTNKGYQFKVEIITKHPEIKLVETETLGVLRVGSLVITGPFSKPTNYFWFDYHNAQLYKSPFGQQAQRKLQGLAGALGLSFHKLTYLELAADSATNYLPRIAAALSDPALRVFTLGKAPDTDTQEYRGLNWEVWQSARGITNTALRLKNREKTMELYCYDKAREIGVSGKTYISAATGLGAKGHWRYELRLHADCLDPFLTAEGKAWQDLFPGGAMSEAIAERIYLYFAQRLLRAKAYRGSTLSRKALQFWEFPVNNAFSPLISIGGLNAHTTTEINLYNSSVLTINL